MSVPKIKNGFKMRGLKSLPVILEVISLVKVTKFSVKVAEFKKKQTFFLKLFLNEVKKLVETRKKY